MDSSTPVCPVKALNEQPGSEKCLAKGDSHHTKNTSIYISQWSIGTGQLSLLGLILRAGALVHCSIVSMVSYRVRIPAWLLVKIVAFVCNAHAKP